MKIAGKIRRDVKLLERQWPWALLTCFFGVVLLAFVGLTASGAFERIDPVVWGRNVRGYTGLGMLLGFLGVALLVTPGGSGEIFGWRSFQRQVRRRTALPDSTRTAVLLGQPGQRRGS